MLFNVASVEAITRLLSHPSWDILVILFFLAAGFFYGILAGTKRLLSVLFSAYISVLLLNKFAYLDFLTEEKELLDTFIFKLLIFFVLITLLCIIFNKTIFRGIEKNKKWLPALILSFLEVGLLISAVFQLLPARELFTFSPIVERLFASEQAFFWWLILPIFSLFFIVRKRAKIGI